MSDSVVIVVGQGEIGKPLQTILSRTYHCIGVDIEPIEAAAPCSTEPVWPIAWTAGLVLVHPHEGPVWL